MIKNKLSDEWIHVKEFCESELEKLREQNDSPTHDLAETAMIRGQIFFAKKVLDLEKVDPKIEIVDNSYLPD